MSLQNDITAMRQEGEDLSSRWLEIRDDLLEQTGFQPAEKTRQSQWYKTGKVGAVSLHGTYQGKPAVLKIQGTKPATSEAKVIERFNKQNQSSIIRAPKIYRYLPWDEGKEYEATIFEEVDAPSVMPNRPPTQKHLDHFFKLYEEYRRHARRQTFLKNPGGFSYKRKIKDWQEAVAGEQGEDRYGDLIDQSSLGRAVSYLDQVLLSDSFEFVHGHFYPGDLLVNRTDDIVLFSHLFWSWRNPFYDAVFGYAWVMLELETVPHLTLNKHQAERRRWLDRIYSLREVNKHPEGERWINIALLERTTAGLIIDRFMMDQSKPQAETITRSTMEELKRLLKELDLS